MSKPAEISGEFREFHGSLREQSNLLQRYLDFESRYVTTYRLEKQPLLPPGFQVESKVRSSGGFTLARTRSTASGLVQGLKFTESLAVRGVAEIARDSRDQFTWMLRNSGSEVELAQLGRSQRVGPRSFAFSSEAAPMTFRSRNVRETKSDTISLMMPNDFVKQRLWCAEKLCLRPNDISAELRELAFATVGAISDGGWNLSADEFSRAIRVVADVALLALDAAASVSSSERSVRIANLARVKHIIRRRLTEPDLSLADVAREAGLTLNYLHKLFGGEEHTMYEYLKSQRLEKARKLLEAPASRSVTIAEISVACGFSDNAYFSRLFKQTFGVSPRELRPRARHSE